MRAFFNLNWIRDTPRERLERIYAELVEQGVIGAAVEPTYTLGQLRAALAHAQQTGRHGKFLFTPARSAS
ncbi:hypothetical protein ACIRQP_32850 [Streptomyces sp. NPDC102274]|uniref:hypothetical protein n=1 Tax=Streptomyces sp. NPDC102274 TaxID=3366151 RepID=UPI0038114CE8